MSGPRLCRIDGCTSISVGRRLCRTHYNAAWKKGDFAHAPLEPRKRARTVCPPDHKHAGASTCYIQHQCRCTPCRDHHTAMEQRRERLKAYGRWDGAGLVDAEPVREHMMLLAEFGIGYNRAARLAGIGTTAARTIIWGRQGPGPRNGELQKRVKRTTAEALLRVKPTIDNLAPGQVIPSRGARRRVQALVANGWSMSEVGRRIGVDITNFSTMMHRELITVRYHRAIAALYEELWNAEPPQHDHRTRLVYSRSRRFARERRWLPPLAWDDIDNDVEPPVAEEAEGAIDEMAVELAVMGERVRLSPVERREAVRRLHSLRLSDGAIAARLHIADRTVLRIRQELGLPAAVGADGEAVA